jgi:Mg/Co/Ni transporter MgtE
LRSFRPGQGSWQQRVEVAGHNKLERPPVAEIENLTLSYLDAHAPEAARVLERMPSQDAAELFARVPARTGAAVLAAMLPSAAARVIAQLDDSASLALLAAVGTQTAVAMLRLTAQPRRDELLRGLPTTTSIAAKFMLGYPDDSVGAWIDPDVIALPPETRAADALERVRAGEETIVDQLYVIGPDQRLLGIVDLHRALRALPAVLIEALMQPPVVVLSAVTPLTSAATQRGWERSSALPAVERDGRLIGVLRRGTLARALARSRIPSQAPGDPPLSGIVARGYWDAFSGLAEAMVSSLPPAKPVYKEES